MWIAYLAGVSLAFSDGLLRIYQTVATKHRFKVRPDCRPRGPIYGVQDAHPR